MLGARSRFSLVLVLPAGVAASRSSVTCGDRGFGLKGFRFEDVYGSEAVIRG